MIATLSYTSLSMLASMSLVVLAMFVTFIFVIEIGSGLDSNPFYDDVETSHITSIYDIFL
jgi:hypothetical protein